MDWELVIEICLVAICVYVLYRWIRLSRAEKVPLAGPLKCPRCGAENPEIRLIGSMGVFRLDEFRSEATVIPDATCRECGGSLTLVFELKEVK